MEKLPFDDEFDPRCQRLKENLRLRLYEAYADGCRHFICGFALGADTLFAEEALSLRALHDDVTLEAALPCETQADGWRASDKERYRLLLKACDSVTYVSRNYYRACFLRRNDYIIFNSQRLIAVFDKNDSRPGGTAYTIRRAAAAGLQTIIIEP